MSRRKWILIACIVILAVAGAVTAAVVVRGRRQAEKNVYIGISHLENGRSALAENYLNQVGSRSGKKIGFAKDAAEALKEKMDGNDILTSIRIQQIRDAYSIKEEQQNVLSALAEKGISQEGYAGIGAQIKKLLKVPEKRSKQYDAQFELENQAMASGHMSSSERAAYATLVNEEAASSLAMSAAISRGNYQEAFREAVQMVDKKPSAKNQLLLADVIAEGAYAGYTFTENDLKRALGEDVPEEDPADQYASGDAEDVPDPETALAYRAMNAISGNPGIEKQLVKAKLQYAVGDEEKAVDTLVKASESVFRAASDNEAVDTGLNVIHEIYKEGNTAAAKNKGSEKLIATMFDSIHEGLIIDRSSEYRSSSRSVSEDLSSASLGEYRYTNSNVHIAGVDDSAFPQITVTLYGREEAIEEIRKNQNVEIKDTHYPVQFTVAEQDAEKKIAVCFVVDVSGSMGGGPIQDAKEALVHFVEHYMDGNMEAALVSFDNSARIVTPKTADPAEMIAGIESLDADGGTNLTAGISVGLEAIAEEFGIANMIMMTDGQSDFDYGVLDQANQSGITIFTVGFGSVDEDVLTEIAENTGGTFTLADNSSDLSNVYAAIGAIIGNRLTLTYTVTENTEELPRYFFLHSERTGESEKVIYRREKEHTQAESFSVHNALVYSLGEMERVQNGEVIEAALTVSGAYRNLVSIRIGDREVAYTIPDREGELILTLDQFMDIGLYDAEFVFADGSSCNASDVLLVYDSEAEGNLAGGWLRIGSTALYGRMITTLPTGEIVVTSPEIRDVTYIEDGSTTLEAHSDNLMVMTSCTPSYEPVSGAFNRYYDWGTDAAFRLDGLIYLNYGDAQYDNLGNPICSAGKLEGIIDADQCTITETESVGGSDQ